MPKVENRKSACNLRLVKILMAGLNYFMDKLKCTELNCCHQSCRQVVHNSPSEEEGQQGPCQIKALVAIVITVVTLPAPQGCQQEAVNYVP